MRRRGTKLRKLTGTGAACLVWSAPEVAFMLFVLWVWWDDLWPHALAWWDERRIKDTRLALKNDLSANVRPIYVHMMTTIDRAERERKARLRQRWRSRFRSVRRVVMTVFSTMNNGLKEAGEFMATKISIHDPIEIDE